MCLEILLWEIFSEMFLDASEQNYTLHMIHAKILIQQYIKL